MLNVWWDVLFTGAVEPVSPSEANPDLSRLRLIKESELKRSSIIGSGAFGTVFKVYYSLNVEVELRAHQSSSSMNVSNVEHTAEKIIYSPTYEEAEIKLNVYSQNCLWLLTLCITCFRVSGFRMANM